MIVSRCSLKYIKDQTSCEAGGKRASTRGIILPPEIKFEVLQIRSTIRGLDCWVSFIWETMSLQAGVNQLIRLVWLTAALSIKREQPQASFVLNRELLREE